jgi:crotonobetainyl-CoA:carnitine CoA-transferase CaiB-like acyl-CoA transferase
MAASAPTVFARLARAWGREDLLVDDRFATNTARLAHRDEIEGIARAWFAARTLDEASAELRANDVSFAPIYDIRDVFADPHFAAREAIVTVDDERLGPVRMQGVVPRFSDTPGGVWRTGPELGQHTDEVLQGELGMSPTEVEALRARGVV